MQRIARLLRVAAAAVLVAVPLTISSAQADSEITPAGWQESFGEDYVMVRSPTDARGGVVILTPVLISFDGPVRKAVDDVAAKIAGSFGGKVLSITPFVPNVTVSSVLPDPVNAVVRRPEGELHVSVYARLGSLMTGNQADAHTLQFVVIAAPAAIRNGKGEDGRRWREGMDQVLAQFRNAAAMTPEFLETIKAQSESGAQGSGAGHPGQGQGTAQGQGAGQVSGQAPAAGTPPSPPKPSPQTQAPAAPAEVIWSARGSANGVVFVAPCSTDGATVIGALRSRDTVGTSNMAPMLVSDTRDTVQLWSGGRIAGARFSQVAQQGDVWSMTADFEVEGGRVVGWFAIRKHNAYVVQRAYALAPVNLAKDARFETIRTVVLRMLQAGDYGALDSEGDPPQTQPGSSDVEGLFALSGLALALEQRPLTLRRIEIGLFKNGGATETAANLNGAWRRISGGYSVSYDGSGGSYVARVSETCRMAAAVPSRPVPPAPSPVGKLGRSCSSNGIVLNFPRATSRRECSTIGGQYDCRLVPAWVDSTTTVHPNCP